MQLTLFGFEEHPLLDKLRNLELNETTPLQALAMLTDWQQELREESSAKPR